MYNALKLYTSPKVTLCTVNYALLICEIEDNYISKPFPSVKKAESETNKMMNIFLLGKTVE